MFAGKNRLLAKRGPGRWALGMALWGALLLAAGSGLGADEFPQWGADAVPDLYTADLAGSGGFSTSTGGAPASALNPALGGTEQRIVFDASWMTLSDPGDDPSFAFGNFGFGALFPTRYGVFGGSFHMLLNGMEDFPTRSIWAVNLNAAKEIYPGMSLGAGFNFGGGGHTEELTVNGDLGFRYNTGTVGALHNFTYAIVLRSLGLSWAPTWLTPMGGVSFDVIRIEREGEKRDPFVLNLAGDLSFPSLFYPVDDRAGMIFKMGLKAVIAEAVTISASWPGDSGLNVRELARGRGFQPIPSVGIGVDIVLPTGGKRIAGGRLPADGDLLINGAYKPLSEGVTAIGGGVTWKVGIPDKKPPVITIDYADAAYFSPNHDGKADYLEFPVSITDANYVASWKWEIQDADGNVVRTIENKEQRPEFNGVQDFFVRLFSVKKQVAVPPVFQWNGIRDSGDIAPDGDYTFTITATDDRGNTAASQPYQAVLKTVPPQIAIAPLNDAQRIFNPSGESKAAITFTPSGSSEDRWEGGIYNAAGVKVRTFEAMSGQPRAQVWDGKDDSGKIAPDGVYSYQIGATDRAQNTANATLSNIILDARVAGAFVTSSVAAIAPKSNQNTTLVDFGIRLSPPDGVESWKLELKDETGAIRRAFSGGTSAPDKVGWNGLDEQGAIHEGIYTPELTAKYTKGDVVTAAGAAVTVDISGPKLDVALQPEYFSPDNDGVDDDLLIGLTAADISPIAAWSMEIREPEPPYPVFYRIEGKGSPAGQIKWNGRSNKGELVQSAMDYPYTFQAADILGNASSKDGKIGVDVLVIRDGDRLRIQIPSIVFTSNSPSLKGNKPEDETNNIRILRRIAQILNKFRDYKVQVEGHANPVLGTADEETRELKPLSEKRAQAVVDWLARNGSVTKSRLFSTGVGGTRPVVSPNDKDNRWKNRRVEFILIK